MNTIVLILVTVKPQHRNIATYPAYLDAASAAVTSEIRALTEEEYLRTNSALRDKLDIVATLRTKSALDHEEFVLRMRRNTPDQNIRICVVDCGCPQRLLMPFIPYTVETTHGRFEFVGRHLANQQTQHWHYYEKADGTLLHFRKEHMVTVTGGTIEQHIEAKKILTAGLPTVSLPTLELLNPNKQEV